MTTETNDTDNKPTSGAWTDWQIETARKMWKQGAYAKEIGAVINRTRNAVIGKMHRIKLEGKPKPEKNKFNKLPVVDYSAVLSLKDLREDQCLFPLEAGFCGKKIISATPPYCEIHIKKARARVK